MLKQEITTALIQATKKQDKDSINTIRLILAVIKDKEISMRSNDSSNEITDNEIFLLLKNMINQRQDSIDLYKQGKREDLSINDFNGMGQVMNELKNKFAGRIDMKKASTVVKKILSNNI